MYLELLLQILQTKVETKSEHRGMLKIMGTQVIESSYILLNLFFEKKSHFQLFKKTLINVIKYKKMFTHELNVSQYQHSHSSSLMW